MELLIYQQQKRVAELELEDQQNETLQQRHWQCHG
jgi:hypothetical protein